MTKHRIAILGATGAVGAEMVSILASSDLPIAEVVPLASARSAGTEVMFRGAPLVVHEVGAGHFDAVDFALFSAGAERSRQWAPVAVRAGATVIDNSSAFRMQADVPLVVPEVNPHALESHPGLIANPNCSTIQMVVPLRCLRDLYGLRRVIVATYQSVSGAGNRSMQELLVASRAVLDGTDEPRQVHTRGIAFDCIPEIDVFDAQGWTREEIKMREETRKILELPDLAVSATCVRVPVMRCHSEAVWVQTEKPVDLDHLRAAFGAQQGIEVGSTPDAYRTARQLAGRDSISVGRLRQDPDDPTAVSFWVVSDNLRKGAALNAVQILQGLCSAAGTTTDAG
jgi:aspartate-semialdehyde dehydrogenase